MYGFKNFISKDASKCSNLNVMKNWYQWDNIYSYY